MRAGVTLCACGCLFMCASVTYVRRSLRGGCISYVIPQTRPSERISPYDKWLFWQCWFFLIYNMCFLSSTIWSVFLYLHTLRHTTFTSVHICSMCTSDALRSTISRQLRLDRSCKVCGWSPAKSRRRRSNSSLNTNLYSEIGAAFDWNGFLKTFDLCTECWS